MAQAGDGWAEEPACVKRGMQLRGGVGVAQQVAAGDYGAWFGLMVAL